MARMDTLEIGQVVTLDMAGRYETTAVFAGIDGEGDDREAKFVQIDVANGKVHEWAVYRYNQRWAFGSSADRCRILDVADVTVKI